MDHGGQFERDSRIMSKCQENAVGLCDNVISREGFTPQTQNLNETNALTQTQQHSLTQNEERVGSGLLQIASLNNNGKEEVGYRGKRQGEDEEEDKDDIMREEEESEDSSCFIRCQSPDTPMTDSSFSETGSLLETLYPFSPGTSTELNSPVIPVVSPETAYPSSPVEMGQSDAAMASHNRSNTGSVASVTVEPTFTTASVDFVESAVPSDMRPAIIVGPASITEPTINNNAVLTPEHYTSSADYTNGLMCNKGQAYSYAQPINSPVGKSTITVCTTGLSTSTAVETTATATDSSSTIVPLTSNIKHVGSTCISAPSFTRPIPSPTLLASLEQLAQRGDDTHFPHYLHQIAEAFVHREDYQRALLCIQLERIYHQRILDNLNALQEQWESHCRMSSELTSQHLDNLTHICRTHNRPRAGNAMCASLDFLRPTSEEGGVVSSCSSAHQVETGMEERADDSSLSQIRRLATPPLHSEDCKEDMDEEGNEVVGGVTDTISVTGRGLHPSTVGEMVQSKPADQQGEALSPAQKKEAKQEDKEKDVEEAAEPSRMENEGDEEEQKEGETRLFHRALPEEPVLSGAEMFSLQLQQEVLSEEKVQEETRTSHKSQSDETGLQEVHLSQECYMELRGVCEEEDYYELEQADLIREAALLDDLAKLITVEEVSPASGLVSILKKQSVCVEDVDVRTSSESRADRSTAKRRVRFQVPDDGSEQDVGGSDSCLLLFLLCLVTVVISLGGTALYCALGDAHSSVCQDFSRNADFYFDQIQRGISQVQHWFTPWS
ncbi:consortin isoform X2 [Thalassophryne amazonica]|uniref:consortin isoform X2 n=1 Tax=Thalassophryne amazonica TaxID=390379 RepID=UPI001472218E|nr:consortin isoform X2 [Thalassophryne amazonica]